MRTIFVSIVLVVALALPGYFFFAQRGAGPITPEEKIKKEESQIPSLKPVDFSQINATFRFSGQIPSEFEIEYIPQLKALSIYDSRLSEESVRDKSQIYISSFEANRFLTLSTVEITQQDETFVNGHDAVLYEIAKKPGVPDFPGQPSWRNFKHKAIDIRLTKNNPSIFYSFAYNPVLSESLFKNFIDSIVFHRRFGKNGRHLDVISL